MSHHSCNEALGQKLGGREEWGGEGGISPSEVSLEVRTERCDWDEEEDKPPGLSG